MQDHPPTTGHHRGKSPPLLYRSDSIVLLERLADPAFQARIQAALAKANAGTLPGMPDADHTWTAEDNDIAAQNFLTAFVKALRSGNFALAWEWLSYAIECLEAAAAMSAGRDVDDPAQRSTVHNAARRESDKQFRKHEAQAANAPVRTIGRQHRDRPTRAARNNCSARKRPGRPSTRSNASSGESSDGDSSSPGERSSPVAPWRHRLDNQTFAQHQLRANTPCRWWGR